MHLAGINFVSITAQCALTTEVGGAVALYRPPLATPLNKIIGMIYDTQNFGGNHSNCYVCVVQRLYSVMCDKSSQQEI